MDPLSALVLILTLAAESFGMVKQAGLVGQQDWVKWADLGLAVAENTAKMLEAMKDGRVQYDTLTPEAVRALLLPPRYDEIIAKARAELGLPGDEGRLTTS